MSVCIGNITNGDLRVEFVQSLWASRVGDVPAATCHLFKVWGPYLDDARNFLVEGFLAQTTEDVLLFADSDISWTPENVTELAEMINPDTRPVVGGLYYSGFSSSERNGFAPVAYDWGTHSETKQPFLQQIEEDFTEAKSGLLRKVDAIGTGFLAIHRDLLLRMADIYGPPCPWFDEPIHDGTHHGEDLGFCIRLAEMGVPVYLAPHVRVKHHKLCTL